MWHRALAFAPLAFWGMVTAACGSSSHPAGFADLSTDGGGAGSSSGSSGTSGGLTGLGEGGVTDPSCPEETQFVYVIDQNGMLKRFDPPSVTFKDIGHITCAGQVFSMAVDRQAIAYVLMADGSLVRVDTRNAQCTPTGFKSNQQGFSTTFGMGFSTNAAGSKDETLFVSSSQGSTLAQLDTKTLTLHTVGPYDKISARAEMTGTGDARLFAAFEGSPYVVAEVGKDSAKILSQAPQTAINYPPDRSNFAFAFWGGNFYLFVGPGDSTDVFLYNPGGNNTAKVATESFAVVGAGVSTCAPTAPPK